VGHKGMIKFVVGHMMSLIPIPKAVVVEPSS